MWTYFLFDMLECGHCLHPTSSVCVLLCPITEKKNVKKERVDQKKVTVMSGHLCYSVIFYFLWLGTREGMGLQSDRACEVMLYVLSYREHFHST